MIDSSLDVTDTLKKVSQLNQVIKSSGVVGSLVKRHVFSDRFTELRSLLLDYKQLQKLEQCVMRDVLIKDIIEYLNNPDEVALSEKLKASLIENENLKATITAFDDKLRVLEQEHAVEVEGMGLSLPLDSRKMLDISKALNKCRGYHTYVSQLTFMQSINKETLLKVLGEVIDYLE